MLYKLDRNLIKVSVISDSTYKLTQTEAIIYGKRRRCNTERYLYTDSFEKLKKELTSLVNKKQRALNQEIVALEKQKEEFSLETLLIKLKKEIVEQNTKDLFS